VLGGALLAGAAVFAWRRAAEPPAVDLAGLDPAVVRAVEEARAAVRQAPRSPTAWGRLGMTLGANNLDDAACACLAEAERLDPREPRWPYFQALVRLKTEPDTALAKLQRTVELAPREAAAQLGLAQFLLEQGRYAEARDHYRAVLDNDPSNPWARLGLARLAFEQDQLADALADLGPALASLHTRKAARTLRLLIGQRQGERAADEELRALADLPEDPGLPDPCREELSQCWVGEKAEVSRASALLGRNRLAEAITSLRRTVRDYGDAADAWRMLGRAELMAGDAVAAERSLRTAVGLDPDSVDGQFYRGVALFQAGRLAEALPCFRRALDLKPDFGMAHYNVGQCLKRQGDRAGAAGAFREAIRYLPHKAQGYLALGDVLEEEGRYAEAAEVLRQAARLNPEDAAVRRRLEGLRERAPEGGRP
jgi:tetratricopeptide (TPR) repeat protein